MAFDFHIRPVGSTVAVEITGFGTPTDVAALALVLLDTARAAGWRPGNEKED